MALNDSVSGVSRSGRIRKKSAKLMEMEDFHGGGVFEAELHHHVGFDVVHGRGRKKHSSSSGGKGGMLSPPPIEPKSSNNNLNQLATVASKQRKSVAGGSHQLVATTPKTEQRVIAIKQVAPPSFESLSGSAYLIGDDVHFITGEAVVSDDEDNNKDDDGSSSYLSPLKIDVGAEERTVAALQDESSSGLKMKFILSPKSPVKVPEPPPPPSSSGKGGGHARKKSARSKRLPDREETQAVEDRPKKKKKKKKPQKCGGEGAPTSEGRGGNHHHHHHHHHQQKSLRADSDSDDQDVGSRLIIAEPPPLLQPVASVVASGKSRKKFGGKGSVFSKTKRTEPGKSHGSVREHVGQHVSVYLKEKNSTKKKSTKKVVKTKDKTSTKSRPASAYMLWCREYRNRIVSESPGMDFAAISKKLGEVWQSLSEYEKMNWRRKAKFLAYKGSSSNVINTGKKPSEPPQLDKPPSGAAVGGGGGRMLAARLSVSSSKSDEAAKEVHRPVGTAPLDVAAHLKLLGESLSIIGQRLTEHEGQIAVSGSLSVLLDSTLCVLGPLICLTSEIAQLDGCGKHTQERILDNIAYIMPGL